MSSNDKSGEVATQVKDDSVNDKEKPQSDLKSESSPQKRSASEMNNSEEVKHKHLKADHKDDKENGEAEEKFDEEDEEEAVPEDYDEEDGEGDEDGADDDDDEEDEA